MDPDRDLEALNRDQLVAEVKRLRAGIRAHRDSTGHDLCWHHPDLWGLLPERVTPEVAVPPWPKFLRGCLQYREALERELPNAPKADFNLAPLAGSRQAKLALRSPRPCAAGEGVQVHRQSHLRREPLTPTL